MQINTKYNTAILYRQIGLWQIGFCQTGHCLIQNKILNIDVVFYFQSMAEKIWVHTIITYINIALYYCRGVSVSVY